MQEERSIRDGNIKRFKDSVAELTKQFWCLNDSSSTFLKKISSTDGVSL